MTGHDQGAEVCCAEVLDFVDQQGDAAPFRLRRLADALEEVRKVEFKVAAVGNPKLGIDLQRKVRPAKIGRNLEAFQHAQASVDDVEGLGLNAHPQECLAQARDDQWGQRGAFRRLDQIDHEIGGRRFVPNDIQQHGLAHAPKPREQQSPWRGASCGARQSHLAGFQDFTATGQLRRSAPRARRVRIQFGLHDAIMAYN